MWSPDEHASYYPDYGGIVNRNFPYDFVRDIRLSSDSCTMLLFRGFFAGTVNAKKPFGTRKKGFLDTPSVLFVGRGYYLSARASARALPNWTEAIGPLPVMISPSRSTGTPVYRAPALWSLSRSDRKLVDRTPLSKPALAKTVGAIHIAPRTFLFCTVSRAIFCATRLWKYSVAPAPPIKITAS